MRKIFTLFAAMLLVSTMGFAQQRTTLWEGEKTFDSTWPSVVISSSGLSAKAGDKVVVTVSETDNTIYSGWEWVPQIIIKNAWGEENTIATIDLEDNQTNIEASYELTTGNIAAIKAGSLIIQGMNCIATKVEIESSIERTSTNIWTGNCEFGNWTGGFKVSAEKFATAKAGDILEFIYTTVAKDNDGKDITWWQIKTIDDETKLVLEGNASDLNEYDCANVGQTSTVYKIELTENDANNLKQHGLYANGHYLIVTAVNLLQPKSTPVSSIKMDRVNDGRRYNLNGQLVDENYRGLYIMNGRLHLNK